MNSFSVGFISGMALIVMLGYIFPNDIIPAREIAVAKGHAYYHPNSGEFTWKKECIK